jgi:hypothetical protein
MTDDEQLDAFMAILDLPETSATRSLAIPDQYVDAAPPGTWHAVARVTKPSHGDEDNPWITVELVFTDQHNDDIPGGHWGTAHIYRNGHKTVGVKADSTRRQYYAQRLGENEALGKLPYCFLAPAATGFPLPQFPMLISPIDFSTAMPLASCPSVICSFCILILTTPVDIYPSLLVSLYLA